MTGYNLPPGVTEEMLPGNRPEDIEWDEFHEWIDDIAVQYDIYAPREFKEIILEALEDREE